MTVNTSDVGKVIYVNSGYDLTNNTDLKLTFERADGTTITKTSSDGVTAPSTSVEVEVDGEDMTFEANKYYRYVLEADLALAAGTWKVQPIYVDGTPKDLAGDIVIFAVVARL